MTFRLMPGTGLVLPANAGILRFGMTEHAAQWTASTLADIRAGGWMCGAHWTFFFIHCDILVTAYACTACIDQTMGHLIIERTERVPDRAADVPVDFGDFDLFGYPIHELTEVLDPSERKLLLSADVNPQSTHYLSAVRLDACESDRR
ncbi:hypothetical protein [Streptomyces atratus]|uniref:hypothetical protein n=1 Tax=Streptomyces atratus TaxID=1893 RepID=UPI0021A5EBEF|nr:hypothetical protein [Streptomyces atratus]MCT2543371.1 hypothetical protein [Streptomyces atratus]